MLMALWLVTRLVGLCEDFLNSMVLIMMRHSVPWLCPLPFAQYCRLPPPVIDLFINWMSKMHSCMAHLMKLFIANNLLGLLIRLVPIMCVSSTKLSMASNKPHELGTSASRRSSPQLVFGLLNVTTRLSSTLMGWMWHIFCCMWMTSY